MLTIDSPSYSSRLRLWTKNTCNRSSLRRQSTSLYKLYVAVPKSVDKAKRIKKAIASIRAMTNPTIDSKSFVEKPAQRILDDNNVNTFSVYSSYTSCKQRHERLVRYKKHFGNSCRPYQPGEWCRKRSRKGSNIPRETSRLHHSRF